MMPQQRTDYQTIVKGLEQFGAELKNFIRSRWSEDVDDIFQMASTRAVEHSHTLKDPEKVRPWLYRIVRNVLTDEYRKRASRDRILQKQLDESELEELEPMELCACSISQSKKVKPAYAAILDLVDLKGFSLQEAARKLRISMNNATVRLHRARSALMKAMKEHCGVTNPKDCLDCRCNYDGCCSV